MSKQIFKYPLRFINYQKIEIFEGAEILCIQNQNEVPCIWAMVDTDSPKVTRTFVIFGTGDKINIDNLKYIGTCQFQGGILVYHFCEWLNNPHTNTNH